jgi:RNA polymerase sigma-70 factor (ECF subfamily)
MSSTSKNREQFENHVSRHRSYLYRFAYKLAGDRHLAEDIMQEALLRAWRCFDALLDDGKFLSWVLTILHREHARMFERAPKLAVDIDALPDQDELFLSHRGDDETLDLCRAIYKLSHQQREIMILSTFMGYSTAEVAAILGITAGTALTRQFRAKNRLVAIYSNRENYERHRNRHMPNPRFPLSIASEGAVT